MSQTDVVKKYMGEILASTQLGCISYGCPAGYVAEIGQGAPNAIVSFLTNADEAAQCQKNLANNNYGVRLERKSRIYLELSSEGPGLPLVLQPPRTPGAQPITGLLPQIESNGFNFEAFHSGIDWQNPAGISDFPATSQVTPAALGQCASGENSPIPLTSAMTDAVKNTVNNGGSNLLPYLSADMTLDFVMVGLSLRITDIFELVANQNNGGAPGTVTIPNLVRAKPSFLQSSLGSYEQRIAQQVYSTGSVYIVSDGGPMGTGGNDYQWLFGGGVSDWQSNQQFRGGFGMSPTVGTPTIWKFKDLPFAVQMHRGLDNGVKLNTGKIRVAFAWPKTFIIENDGTNPIPGGLSTQFFDSATGQLAPSPDMIAQYQGSIWVEIEVTLYGFSACVDKDGNLMPSSCAVPMVRKSPASSSSGGGANDAAAISAATQVYLTTGDAVAKENARKFLVSKGQTV